MTYAPLVFIHQEHQIHSAKERHTGTKCKSWAYKNTVKMNGIMLLLLSSINSILVQQRNQINMEKEFAPSTLFPFLVLLPLTNEILKKVIFQIQITGLHTAISCKKCITRGTNDGRNYHSLWYISLAHLKNHKKVTH